MSIAILVDYDTIFVVLGLELGLSFDNVFRRVSELIKERR